MGNAADTNSNLSEQPPWDKSPPTALRGTPNFGPVTLAELEALGFCELEHVAAIGIEAALRCWVEKHPGRLNVNAALGLVTALEGVVWTKATADHYARARAAVDAIRFERGLKPLKPRKPGRARRG